MRSRLLVHSTEPLTVIQGPVSRRYARANPSMEGQRYVMVARSRNADAWGNDAYEPFELIDIEGYNHSDG